MTKLCQNCGNWNDNHAAYCNICGMRFGIVINPIGKEPTGEVKECGRCRGKGYIVTDILGILKDKCPSCNGTGWVRV